MQQEFDAILKPEGGADADDEITTSHLGMISDETRPIILHSVSLPISTPQLGAINSVIDEPDETPATPFSPIVCSFEEKIGKKSRYVHLFVYTYKYIHI